MRHRILLLLVIACLGSFGTPATAITPATGRLTLAEEAALTEMIEAHRRVQARFPEEDRNLLGRLTALVKQQLFAAPWRGDLLGAATKVVSQIIPELDAVEAGSLAEYSLGGIASDTSLEPTMQETQMSFNEQYLQLQKNMQHENLIFTSVSNVLKTRHDTAKNSVGNIR